MVYENAIKNIPDPTHHVHGKTPNLPHDTGLWTVHETPWLGPIEDVHWYLWALAV
jgi:hypothetical protein